MCPGQVTGANGPFGKTAVEREPTGTGGYDLSCGG